MSIARTPPGFSAAGLATTPLNHYASDPQLSLSQQNTDNLENLTYISRRTKRKLDDNTDQGLTQLMSLFADFTSKQDAKMASLNKSINTIMQQNSDIHKTVEFISDRYDELMLKMQKIEEDNSVYKKRINALEAKIDLLERNSRNTSIEIRNVPKLDNENKDTLIGITRDIGSAIGVQPCLAPGEVRDIYRTKSSSIIVDFTTTLKKDSFIIRSKAFNKEMRSIHKPQLNTSHLNFPGQTHNIYLTEYLTMKTNHIFFLARGLVKNKKIAACWTSYSKVYIREAEGLPSRRVDSPEDLHKYGL